MTHDAESMSPELLEARRLLADFVENAQAGPGFADSGADWERVRGLAFRYFVMRPMARGARSCLKALSRVAGRARTAADIRQARAVG